MDLDDNECRVLAFLVDSAGVDGSCYGFDPIAHDTRLDRQAVRRACRSLAQKGLTKYHRSLWSEDGEPAGAGYGATPAGEALRDGLSAKFQRCETCDMYGCECPPLPSA